MAVTNCPHCKADVPPGFDAMPVCMICGGDLNAAPAGEGWAALDTKQDNTRMCPACHAEVKSVFAMECPACQASLTPAGEPVDEQVPVAQLDQERERLEQLLQEPAVEPVTTTTPEPVAAAPAAPPPAPEPVAATARPAAPELPSFVDQPVEKPLAEPVAVAPKAPEPAPVQEGFFAKLLRMLGLKK